MTTNKIIAILFLMFFVVGLTAKDNPEDPTFGTLSKVSADKVTRTMVNIGNWGYWIRYDGQQAHDPNGSSGGFYPRGTAATVYQDGIVWGGFVNDDPDTSKEALRVGGQTYNIGTIQGWIQSNGQAVDPENERLRMYRIRTDWRDLEDNKEALRADAAEILLKSATDVTQDDLNQIWEQYQSDWNDWPADLGAPFVDTNNDGVYDPAVDTAGIANADQVAWFVVNDLNEAAVANLYGSDPIGIELQITMWAYNQPNSTLGQILFKKYKFINKSQYPVDSMFVAQWADPDVGTYTDDLAGCDIEESIGFAYSGFRTDGDFSSFGLPPAAVGYDFFQGPLVPAVAGQDLDQNGIDDGDASQPPAVFDLKYREGFVNLPMTSFLYFAAGSPITDPPLGDYAGTKQWYNMLNGYTPTEDLSNPVPYTAGAGPNAGDPTKFPLSGDPFLKTGDIDAVGTNFAPGDRRIGMASGPFNMAVGDTQEVVVAMVGGIINQQGGDNRNAVAQMKLNDRYAQFLYDNLFADVPKPPAAPIVRSVAMEEQIVLEWGKPGSYEETEKPGSLGYKFEGYNIYQLPSRTSGLEAAKLLGTYDLNNGVQIIRSQQFLPSFGDVVTVPLQKGTDSGIKRSFIIDRNNLTDQPLYAGNSYYFAVTAYNYNPDPLVPEPSLESELNVIEVIPQSPKPGQKFTSMPGDVIETTKSATSTGAVSVTVINPKDVEDKDYQVTFSSDPQYTLDPVTDSTGMIVDYDTLGVWYKWNLLGDGETLLQNQTNLSGDDSYPIVDGLMVRVEGPKAYGYAGWDFAGNRWVSGVNAGGVDFFGGLFRGYNFFGSTLGDADLKPVQLVFQDQADVDANGYIGEGAVYRRDLGYAHQGTGQLPFAAYDVSDPNNPRRVNISFVENDFGDGTTTANLIWDMGWDGSAYPDALGAREYIFIHDSDYNGGVDYDDTNFAPSADVLWAIWPTQRGSRAYLLAEFTMDIFASITNKPSDSWSFSTEGFIENNAQLAKEAVENVNVFPNPYYAYNPSEPSRFQRFVTFNHLPQEATIRIFDLSGVQVRKLEKDTDSQFFRWDLRNESDLPVASGMYVAHIDMPGVGKTKVLKLMVITAQEVLRFY